VVHARCVRALGYSEKGRQGCGGPDRGLGAANRMRTVFNPNLGLDDEQISCRSRDISQLRAESPCAVEEATSDLRKPVFLILCLEDAGYPIWWLASHRGKR